MALEPERHVMLSYQWKSKPVVSKIYSILCANGIKTWMDKNGGMVDNLDKSMNEGIENATAVLCFLTPDYQNSYNCQLELQYAMDLSKLSANQSGRFQIIPCMLGDKRNPKWEPSGWLSLALTGRQWINMIDGSDSNIELKANELLQRINQSLPATTKEATSKHATYYENIRKHYLKENRIKLIANQEKSYPIQQSYINLVSVEAKQQSGDSKKLNCEQHHVLSTFERVNGTKTNVEMKDIFDKCNDQIKRILVLGQAGIGKSTFCQYVTYLWAKGELWRQYELVVLIRLRLLTDSHYPRGKKYSPVDLLEKQYFERVGIPNELQQHFNEHCDSGQVLWILDGYDECVQNIPQQLQDVFYYICQKQHHILTSRPYAIEMHYNTKMEIIGFINTDIHNYIQQFFNHISDDTTDASSHCQKLQRFFKLNLSIWRLAHIPMNLELICSLCNDKALSETTEMTVTKLYDSFILWFCRRYLMREQPQLELQSKSAIYAEYRRELSFLERLAFNAMENLSVIIPAKLLQKIRTHNQCSDLDFLEILNMGILQPYDAKTVDDADLTDDQYHFVHLSFQEYFAARHLLKVLKSSHSKDGIQFIKNHKYNRRFLMVFIFATGLLSESDYQSCNELYWSVIDSDPIDLVGWKHIRLMTECFDEMNSELFTTQRTGSVVQIVKWIEYCASAIPAIIMQHLGASLQRTTSLGTDLQIQSTLLKLLDSQQAHVKLNVLEILSKITILQPSSALLSAVCVALQHDDRNVKKQACEALGKIGENTVTKEVIAALLNALKDEDTVIRLKASGALKRMGEEVTANEAIDALSNVYEDEDAKAADEIGTNETTDALLNALQHEDFGTRRNACKALGKMGNKVAIKTVVDNLMNALKDQDYGVRAAACGALGEMGTSVATKEVIGDLLNALKDDDYRVRGEACRTLGKIGDIAAWLVSIDHLMYILDNVEAKNFEDAVGTILELILCAGSNLMKLNIVELSKVNISMTRSKYFSPETVHFERLLDGFRESGNDAWLPILAYVAFVQGAGITVLDDGVILYGDKEPGKIDVKEGQLLRKLMVALTRQKKEILGDSIAIDENVFSEDFAVMVLTNDIPFNDYIAPIVPSVSITKEKLMLKKRSSQLCTIL